MLLVNSYTVSLFFITTTLLYTNSIVLADSLEGNLRVLYRSLEKCERTHHDLSTCIRLKAVTLLESALTSDTPIVINDYLSLTPDQGVLENVTKQTEQEIEATLPRSNEEKDAALDDLILDKMSRYIQSRSLQFSLPTDMSEGRKKNKGKGGGFIMAALAMGAMLVQLAMGKIALLAGKALLVGKMALLLSAVIGLKKLVGNSGGGESHQVVYATEHGGGGGGWGRSAQQQLDEQQLNAHKMAYSAQARGHASAS